jgi:hypothetical protein
MQSGFNLSRCGAIETELDGRHMILLILFRNKVFDPKIQTQVGSGSGSALWGMKERRLIIGLESRVYMDGTYDPASVLLYCPLILL